MSGGYLSRAEGFTGVGELAFGFAFHAVTMVVGTYLVGKAGAAKRRADPPAVPHQT